MVKQNFGFKHKVLGNISKACTQIPISRLVEKGKTKLTNKYGNKRFVNTFFPCDLRYARKVCPNIEIPFTHPAVHLWKPISHVAYIEFDVKSPATKWFWGNLNFLHILV